MFLLDLRVRRVVGVLIAPSVAEVLHEAGRRVADVERHRLGGALADVLLGLAERRVDRVRLRRHREVERGLGEGQLAFGRAEEVVGVLGGQRERERGGVGVADVLGGEAHQSAGEVERVLARLEHAGEPVESGVGVGVAERLVERRDQVVVLLAALVVEERALLGRLADRGLRDDAPAARVRRRQHDRELEDVERRARVAVGEARDEPERLVADGRPEAGEAALAVGEGAAQERQQLGLAEGVQHVDPAAREERRVDLEGGVFGRGADQDDRAHLDVGQERVLLGAVEAVDLVDEEDRAGTPPGPRRLRVGQDRADLLDAREDGGEGDEPGAGHPRHQPRERRLA